ncbi:MAG: carboxypeptidase M32 [Rhodothermales bacterium]|nr:carboxypeptidase M32 [Rhodothermales bacterium]
MKTELDELTRRLNRITDLGHAAAILEWDQETYIPDGAHDSRAHQIATLRAIAHEESTAEALGNLIAKLSVPGQTDEDAAALVRVAQRDFEKATKLSTDLVSRLATAEAISRDAWRRARESDDFESFAPHLEALIDLNIEKAEALGFHDQLYDALLDQFEEGLLTRTVDDVFAELRAELVPMVDAIAGADGPGDELLRGSFDPKQQWKLSLDIARLVGYDFDRGRLDRSVHPFSTAFSIDDVRITSRIEEDFFSPAFYGTLHEVGHALYEQGIARKFERTPLADGTSLGIHESQSRLWENLVGRSRAFVTFYFDRIKTSFPGEFAAATPADFYRAINAVKPSLIRVEADELTYNLHIMIRFELERLLLDKKLLVRDLPEAWNDLYQRYLGIRPESNANGVLQDIHWSMGAFGYFPTYALGNLISCQFFDAAKRDLGEIDHQISKGSFDPLLAWLRDKIHRHGRTQTAEQLLRSITGGGLSSANWLSYVRTKYGQLYDVDL